MRDEAPRRCVDVPVGVGRHRLRVFEQVGERFAEGGAAGRLQGAEGERLGAGARAGGDVDRAVSRPPERSTAIAVGPASANAALSVRSRNSPLASNSSSAPWAASK